MLESENLELKVNESTNTTSSRLFTPPTHSPFTLFPLSWSFFISSVAWKKLDAAKTSTTHLSKRLLHPFGMKQDLNERSHFTFSLIYERSHTPTFTHHLTFSRSLENVKKGILCLLFGGTKKAAGERTGKFRSDVRNTGGVGGVRGEKERER